MKKKRKKSRSPTAKKRKRRKSLDLKKITKPKRVKIPRKVRRGWQETLRQFKKRKRSHAAQRGHIRRFALEYRNEILSIDGRTRSGWFTLRAKLDNRDKDLMKFIAQMRALGMTLREILDMIFSP